MSEFVSMFGEYAGTIWQTLHQLGPLSEKELLAKTHLTVPQLHAAIGWLARENKIRKENNTYAIGDTNMNPTVGKDAGKIWHALNVWGEVDTLSLSRLSRLKESEVFSAVGWLAREGKVDGVLKNIDEKKILFWLK
ncbi:MAG: winged helix-turn-helix domain-containing protein [Candidatus Thermoplasmatota archaeon]|nr:winged helix-turn-helix domain-containing protein [Candidatus Thermoplasmatota archaeon]